MKLEELTQLRLENTGDDFRETDKKYGPSELSVLAVVHPQTDDYVVAPASTKLGELMECLDNVLGISQMPQKTSRPGQSLFRLWSENPKSNMSKSNRAPPTKPDLSLIQNVKLVELGCFSSCI